MRKQVNFKPATLGQKQTVGGIMLISFSR